MKKPANRRLSIICAFFAVWLTACGGDKPASKQSTDNQQAAPTPQQTYEWKMVTTWPKNFPTLGTGANNLAKSIEEMSGGRLKIKVYAAGELVGAFESFDAVSRGTVQMGHGSAYYWKGKVPIAQLFSTVPFGFNAQEMNAWLYYGGGLELWQKLYEKFNLVPIPAGNTGVQMGGWFNKELNSVEDLKGLKIRMPGLGGEVLTRAGATTVNLPGGELYTALQSGNIDATEWVGPYNDLAFGFHQIAQYYYYPGWHEAGTAMEVILNKEAFDGLPKDLQAIVLTACKAANGDMLYEFTARNNAALKTLVEEHGVQLRKFPDDVLEKLNDISQQVVEELVAANPDYAEIYDSYRAFNEQVTAWHDVSEKAFLEARDH